MKVWFGDFGPQCAIPSSVCLALNPDVASVGFRARGCQELADLNRSPRHIGHQMSGRFFQLERSIQLDLIGRGP
jgi:hypothetical protein